VHLLVCYLNNLQNARCIEKDEIGQLLQKFKGRKRMHAHTHTEFMTIAVTVFYHFQEGGKTNRTVSLYLRKVYGERKWRYLVFSFGSWWN